MDAVRYKLSVSCAPEARVSIPESRLADMQARYDAGQYLEAFRLGLGLAPLHAWRGSRARILGSRLAARLGGDRLSSLLATTAWRESPRDAQAVLYRGYELQRTSGLLAAWEFTTDWESLEGLTEETASDLLAFRARVAGAYRDFECAGRLLEQAQERLPNSPWLWAETAGLLITEDRISEAVDACEWSLHLQPWFRPAVQTKAHLLARLRGNSAAAGFLGEAAGHLQSAEVYLQWFEALREEENPGEMLVLLEAYEAHSPLLEGLGREWLAGRRCDALCLSGDWGAAAEQADAAGGEAYRELALRLRSPRPQAGRVRLKPPRLFQEWNTCGPTTLAMLAGFWGHEATQEAIVEAICYDGTQDHRERQWCLDHGLRAREFQVTWEAAKALVDAGFPFALTTVEVTSGHLQALVGYDLLRRSFLLQDPSSTSHREVLAEPFLKEYALHGPRGLVLAPPEAWERLAGIPLPQAEAYDTYFAFCQALDRHQRSQAEALCRTFAEGEPTHRLLAIMRLALATYDRDAGYEAEALEVLLRMFPEDPRLHLRKANLLREQGLRRDYQAFLFEAARRDGAHPVLLGAWAVELAGDARQAAEAWRWLRRAHVGLPWEASLLEAWGDLRWRELRRDQALEAYGFAACLLPTQERQARLWFDVAHTLGRREEALQRLWERNRRLGPRSPLPARTLLWTLYDLNRDAEADAVLAEALARFPDDGSLRIDAAQLALSRGEIDAAEAHLDSARELCPIGSWLRALAGIQERREDYASALATWRDLEGLEPTTLEVQGAIARLLEILEGSEAAVGHLEQVLLRFPHHYALHGLRYERLRDPLLAVSEGAVRELLRIHPGDAWSLRELALLLVRDGRSEEALAHAEEARARDPHNAASEGIRGGVLESMGREEEAREAFRAALRLDVDYVTGMRQLVGLAKDAAQRREALEWIHGELLEQEIHGAALETFRELAFPLLEPEDLLERLQAIQSRRRDLYEAWAVLLDQLEAMGRHEEAARLLEEVLQRFGRLPGAWILAARIHRQRGESSRALAAARMATDLNPRWSQGWRALAQDLVFSGAHEEALEALHRGLRCLPMESSLQTDAAQLLWKMGRREEAFQAALGTARRFPGDPRAWEMADAWGDLLGHADRVLTAARHLTRDRPGEARSWMLLGRVLPRSAMDEKLLALDRALQLNPRLVEAYDQKAWLLATQGRFQEAEKALHASPFGTDLPHPLLGRAAWLQAYQGKAPAGVKAMEQILALHPDYFWGWEQLLEWCKSLKDRSRMAKARAALARLAPRDAEVLVELGEGAQADGQYDEAEDYYQRAMTLAPGSVHALVPRLRLAWVRRDLTAIRKTAESVLPGQTQAVADTFLLMADLLQAGPKEVRAGLESLVRREESFGFVVADLLEGFRSCKQEKTFFKVLGAAVRDRSIGMSFAPCWVEHRLQERDGTVWRHFEDWIARGHEGAGPALVTYFDGLGELRLAGRAKGFFSSPEASWVRERGQLFGKAGYALAQSGCWKEAAAWLSGAEHREDAEGWLCSNLVLALSHLDREEEATAVARRVVERGLRDQTWSWHQAQLAFSASVQGDAPAARCALEEVQDLESEAGTWYWKRRLAEHVVRILEAEPKHARRQRRAAIRALRSVARQELLGIHRLTKRHYGMALRRMTAHAGGFLWPWDRFLG